MPLSTPHSAPRTPPAFTEYIVFLDDTGEMKGFDEWPDARRYIRENCWDRFHPFRVECVKYFKNGNVRTLWDVEWTDPAMAATREDRKFFRRIGAGCLLQVFKWAAN